MIRGACVGDQAHPDTITPRVLLNGVRLSPLDLKRILQSLSPTFRRRGAPKRRDGGKLARPANFAALADWKSAIRQTGSLRYVGLCRYALRDQASGRR